MPDFDIDEERIQEELDINDLYVYTDHFRTLDRFLPDGNARHFAWKGGTVAIWIWCSLFLYRFDHVGIWKVYQQSFIIGEESSFFEGEYDTSYVETPSISP